MGQTLDQVRVISSLHKFPFGENDIHPRAKVRDILPWLT